MAFNDRSLDDYIDVPQRLADFRAKHADGSLQRDGSYEIVRVPNGWCRQCIGRRSIQTKQKQWIDCPRCQGTGLRAEGEPQEDVFIVYTAAAYRGSDDAKPGIGTAWEPYPGQTPYTSGSELMNAETSAWGRAIVAALAADAKRGVSSREEVRNRAAEREPESDSPPQRHRPTGPDHERLIPGQSAEDRRNGKKADRVKGKAPEDEWTTPAETDQDWFKRISEDIKTFTTDGEGDVLRRRVIEKADAGGCTKEDAEKLRTLIRARRQAIAVEHVAALPEEVPADAG